MYTLEPVDELEKLIQRFQQKTVNHTYALNFLLGTLKSRLYKGESLSAEELLVILESTLRFSKIRN